jgi:hypothetical protein
MLAEDYEQGKLVNPELLFETIKMLQATMGCPQQPRQTTTCIARGGAFTCTTR